VPTRRLRPLAVIAGMAISVFLSYLAVRDVDFDTFVDALADSSYWWIAPSLAALAASVAIRVIRWRYLFPAPTRPPSRAALRALLIGEFFNAVLPMRAGEIARVVAIHREARTSRSEALGTVVVERVLDVLVLLLLLLAVFPFVPDVSWLGAAVVILAAVGVGAIAAVLVLWRYQARPLGFLLRPLRWLPGVSDARATAAAESLLRGLQGWRSLRAGLVALALTVATWLVVALSFWLAMRGLHLGFGYDAAVLVVVATTFALVIPSLPASLGVFEAATVVSLEPFGVGDSRALACAVVLHALSFVPFIAAGLIALGRHPELHTRQPEERASVPSANSQPPAPLNTTPTRMDF
jgi:glycosyltransferase 2 family protein